MEARNSCVASSAGCCTGRDEKCPQKLLKGLGQSTQQPVLGASHTAVPYRENSSRDISYCEALMFPYGKSNVSPGFPQDGYFPSGLWEVAAPLLPAQDCEQRCHAAPQHRIKQEQSLGKRNVCSWQWDAASPSPCLRSERVAMWCRAVPCLGNGMLWRACALPVLKQHLLWAEIRLGGSPKLPTSPHHCFLQLGPGGIVFTKKHKGLLHSQEGSEEPRKLFPLNS